MFLFNCSSIDFFSCGKEYHMECCTPPLYEVPEGSFYCFDCSPKGSAAQLEEYLENHDTERHNYYMDRSVDSVCFVDSLLFKDCWTENPSKEYPRSELDWIHQNDPESLIGKAVRIYSAKGNSYHNGKRHPCCMLGDTFFEATR